MLARILIAVAVLVAMVVLALILATVKELRSADDRDTRPYPSYRAVAFDRGAPLVDEQGHRLRFATPEVAAKYAADYAKP